METLPKLQPCDNVINKIDEYREIASLLSVEKFEEQNNVDAFAEHYLSERFGQEYGEQMYANLHSTTYQFENLESGEHIAVNLRFLRRYEPITLYINVEDLKTGNPAVVLLEEQNRELVYRPGRELSPDAVRGIALDLHTSMYNE